jgi:hypothetical protein
MQTRDVPLYRSLSVWAASGGHCSCMNTKRVKWEWYTVEEQNNEEWNKYIFFFLCWRIRDVTVQQILWLGGIISTFLFPFYICICNKLKLITVVARSREWFVFARSNTGIMGPNPIRGMDVCVRLFTLCVVLCVGRDLATGWSPI